MPNPIRNRNPLVSLALLLVAAATLSACGGPAARTAKYMSKGQAYMTEGNFEKARLEFRNALQMSPNNAAVRLQNGVVAEKLADYQHAAQFYQGVIDLDKGNAEARAHFGRLLLLSGAAERALEIVQPGLDLHPDDVGLLTTRAIARARLNDMPAAMTDAERAIKLAPLDETAVTVLAGLYAAGNRPADAQALLEGALAKVPQSVDLRQVLVQFYSSHDQNPRAEALLKDLVRLKPADKTHRLDLARFYSSTDRLDDAERTLREAISAARDDASLRLSLVDFLNVRRGREAAEKELQAQIAAHADDYDLVFALGHLYELDKRPDKSEVLYRQVIVAQDLKPAGITARDRLAAVDLQRNDAVAAGRLLAEVLAANPRDTDALLMRSDIALVGGDPRAAIVDLRAVLRDKPDSVPLLRQLARAYMAAGETQLGEDVLHQAMQADPNDSPARADLAQLYLQGNRPEQARPLAEELAKRDPRNLDYQQLVFRAAAALKDYDAAGAAADSIRTDHADLPVGWYLSGLLAESRSHFDEALRDYDKALELNGQADEPLAAEVKLLVRQKKLDAALSRVAAIRRKFPELATAANTQGELMVAQKRWDDAQAAFNDAATNAPRWWVPQRNLAYVRIGRKDTEGAIALLQASAAKLGQPEPLVTELASLLQGLGRSDEAIAAYEALLKQNPGSELGANNLAMLLVTHRSEPASLDRARELVGRLSGSRNPDYLDTNGWVLYRHGEANAALPVLQKALDLAPDAALIRYHLAVTQHSVGQTRTALDNLQRALQGGRQFEGADDARAKLAEWKKSG